MWIWYRIPEGFPECQGPPPKNQQLPFKPVRTQAKDDADTAVWKGNSLFPGKISMSQLHGKHIYVVISLPPYTNLWTF